MDESAQQILENLTEVEAAAEDILADKQQVRMNSYICCSSRMYKKKCG